MKILHCADLHLNAAFSGLDVERADVRRAEMRESLARIVEYVRDEKIDLMLIAGDLFDTPYCSARARAEIFEILGGAACPVVISPGNHDHYAKDGVYSGKDMPENVFVFTSEEIGRFDFDEIGVTVCGYAYTSEKYEHDPLADGAPVSDENINIFCAHTDLRSTVSTHAPMTAGEIARQGFTYAALGHVHMAPPPQRIGGCTLAYSGFMQGRGFDETGEGGIYLVDIDREKKSVTLEKKTVSGLCYVIERLDISGCERDVEVITKIMKLISDRGYGKNTALRVILEGAVSSDYTPSKKKICSSGALSELALIDVKDESVSTLGLERLASDSTVRGEFYRALAPMLESDNADERYRAKLALSMGLAALDKRELSLGSSDGEGEI